MMAGMSPSIPQVGNPQIPKALLRVIFDRYAAGSESGHVGCAPKNGSNIKIVAFAMTRPWRVDNAGPARASSFQTGALNHPLPAYRLEISVARRA
jgi:hypothetical protein